MQPIGMLDLKAEFPSIEADVRAALETVLAGQAFVGGPQVGELECALAGQFLHQPLNRAHTDAAIPHRCPRH